MVINKALKRLKNKREYVLKTKRLYESNKTNNSSIKYYDGILEGIDYAINILEKYKEQEDKNLYNKL